MKGIGATWVKRIDRTYDVGKMRDALTEALTTRRKARNSSSRHPNACSIAQRREKPLRRQGD